MAAITNVWVPGFSENPAGQPLVAQSIIEMLGLIGDEIVPPPSVPAGSGPNAGHDSGRAMSRRELLARVLWTRAILDADGTATKLIIEYLDGKPGETAGTGAGPAFTADDMALAEALLREGVGHE